MNTLQTNDKAYTTSLANIEGAKLMIVDDNPDLLTLMSMRLKPLGFELCTAESGEEALGLLEHFSADLVITDLQMPGMSGIELFELIHQRNPLRPVIILTAHGTITEAVEATQAGVAGYLSKPFESQELLEKIQSTLLASGFLQRSDSGIEPRAQNQNWAASIIHKSSVMSALIAEADVHAKTDNLLLIEGAPGTGKDQFARALHSASARANRPLMQVSCAALPSKLFLQEVFGRIGDGTHLSPARRGLLQKAQGGTMVFSDYNELSDDLMHSVLAALTEKRAVAVDGGPQYAIDVRPIATTSVRIRSGQRARRIWGLAQELNCTDVRIPSLNARRDDIPLLANYCLEHHVQRADLQFSTKAMQTLMMAEWPGNVRHLMNVVQQCAHLTSTRVIPESLVNSRISSPVYSIEPLSNALRDFERNYLVDVLKATNGNVTKASELAKRNRTEFHRLLKKHALDAKSFRQH